MRILIALCLLIPFSANAFNYVGHVVIAEAAYKMLERDDQKRLNELAETARDEGNLTSTFRAYRGVSSFATAVTIPERVKSDSVADIYAEFGATVPAALSANANTTTAEWHYIDRPYKAQSCATAFIGARNIETALADLKAAYGEASDDETRAITMAFIAHLVGDAHQPLNTVSMDLDPEAGCAKDRGGMKFCIVEREDDQPCPAGKNLHAFWESAAESMEDRKRINHYVRKVLRVAQRLDENELKGDVASWTQESHGHADFAYNTPVDEWPSRKYESEAADLAVKQMARAAVRLKMMIEELN